MHSPNDMLTCTSIFRYLPFLIIIPTGRPTVGRAYLATICNKIVYFLQENFREYFHPENLDEKIERLLNTRVDYTFPISDGGEVLKDQAKDESSKESESTKTN